MPFIDLCVARAHKAFGRLSMNSKDSTKLKLITAGNAGQSVCPCTLYIEQRAYSKKEKAQDFIRKVDLFAMKIQKGLKRKLSGESTFIIY